MSQPDLPVRPSSDGVLVRMRVNPKAARDCIEGIEPTRDGPALKARVRAVPEDGAANAALTRLLAAWLGVAKSAVALTSGARSRVKTLSVTGHTDTLLARARARLAETADNQGNVP